jgi:hypothetical protein
MKMPQNDANVGFGTLQFLVVAVGKSLAAGIFLAKAY